MGVSLSVPVGSPVIFLAPREILTEGIKGDADLAKLFQLGLKPSELPPFWGRSLDYTAVSSGLACRW